MPDLERGSAKESTDSQRTITPERKSHAVKQSIFFQMLAEFLGTMIIVLVGLMALSALTLTESPVVTLQVGLMFGLGIAWGVYMAGPISDGHLNPALTFAIAVLRPSSFKFWKLPCYWTSQYLGALAGAAITYAVWSPAIAHFETRNGIVRGEPESDITFALFGAVFPLPAAAQLGGWPQGIVSPPLALLAEAVGTALQVFVSFVVLDKRNTFIHDKSYAPVLIGLSCTATIVGLAPISTASCNPARDGGPRVLAALAGWGSRAFPGNQNGFWIYFVGPMIGAIFGGGAYDLVLARVYICKDD